MNIDTALVHDIIAAARAATAQVAASDDTGSNATDDDLSAIRDDGGKRRSVLAAMIDGLNEDEKRELIALAWIGREDYSAEEWTDALDRADLEREKTASAVLLDMPLVADHIANGLAAMDAAN